MASIREKVSSLFREDRGGVTQMLFKSRVEELVLKALEELVSKDRKKVLVELKRILKSTEKKIKMSMQTKRSPSSITRV